MDKLNEAPILDQLEGQWEKVCLMLLWKLVGMGKTVTITHADLAQIFETPMVLYTRGHSDSMEFGVVTPERAQALVEFQKTQRGSA